MLLIAMLAAAGIVLVLVDAFETILQPRRVTHRFRFASLYYRLAWKSWRALAMIFRAGKRREACLSFFGPLSLLGLFVLWFVGLIVSFAILHWSLGTPLHSPDSRPSLGAYLYFSGTTFFTLGFGDVVPSAFAGRALAVIEAGLGFGLLAVVISYLPILYQAFSLREVMISLLDARASSPPSAAEFLLRLAESGHIDEAERFLIDWERWAAELLESHLSFPVLSYYRSQHDNQSWLAALTMMLDTCAILLVDVPGALQYQAQLTFAICRHAAVDLGLILRVGPKEPLADRLSPEAHHGIRRRLAGAGVSLQEAGDDGKLGELRQMYEPFVEALARELMFPLPPIVAPSGQVDNWQRSAYQRRTPGIGSLARGTVQAEHFG